MNAKNKLISQCLQMRRDTMLIGILVNKLLYSSKKIAAEKNITIISLLLSLRTHLQPLKCKSTKKVYKVNT